MNRRKSTDMCHEDVDSCRADRDSMFERENPGLNCAFGFLERLSDADRYVSYVEVPVLTR